MINYGYFRHRFDAHNNPKLNNLIDEIGVIGYGYYYTLIEIYGAKYSDKNEDGYVEIHARTLANVWRKRVDSCDKVLTKLQLSGLLVYTKSPLTTDLGITKSSNTYLLNIPNFLKYYGSYKKKTPSTPPNKSKVNKSKVNKSKVNIKELGEGIKYESNPENVISIWNNISQENNYTLPKAKVLNTERINSINTCIRDFPEMRKMQDWKNYFIEIHKSDFLTGRNGGWKASFDWVIKKKNLTKIVEGNYENILKHSKAQITQDNIINMENPYE
jgi:hypothetical protein